VLAQLDLSWQRARSSLRSPDPHYDAKLAAIQQALAQAAASHGRIVTLYQDEVTLERQPSLANAYSRAGHDQPRARRSHQANTLTRITATLDPQDGRVLFHRASHITVPTLVRFYQQLVAAYPDTQLQLVQDNWPVHHHPDLLVALQPQATPFPWYRPGNWPTEPSAAARERWGHLQLPIQLLPLPTYASWCNPIEKLWRWLKQELLHLHRLADDLPALRAATDAFLRRFQHGSAALLRYVGLLVPS
jgi:DDE superfamily endonuclease